jgi:nitrite reductase/ring-hydroxylating ferredoxin subunit/Fe-S cluster biogenesis protein NfuA
MAAARPLPKTPEADPAGLDDLLGALDAAEAALAKKPDPDAARLRDAVEALNGEALRRLIAALKDIPEAMAALRTVAEDEVVYAVLRRHGLIKPSLQERVETALASIRPTLASHGGDVELVRVLPPAAVEVRFLGNCDNCPASVLTFTAGVKRAIKEHCPEITEIRQARGQGGGSGAVHYVSPFAKNRAGAWHEVLPLAALEDGGARMLTVAGEALILSRQGDRVSCFRNACAHLGMPLDGGEIKDGIITCPHHGFEYDLLSGECLTAAEVQLEPFVVRVVDDRVDVQLGA